MRHQVRVRPPKTTAYKGVQTSLEACRRAIVLDSMMEALGWDAYLPSTPSMLGCCVFVTLSLYAAILICLLSGPTYGIDESEAAVVGQLR